MPSFQGKRVSEKWKVVLDAAADEDVRFKLNSGQRTITEQWALYRLYKSGRGNLAAFPNPNAPHIRTGRQDHALDINSLDGGETRLERWVESKGVDWKNTVPGESWHGEVSPGGLNKLYAEYARPPGYTPEEWRWIKEYDYLLRNRKDKQRRQVLRSVMKTQRQIIWREAQKTGWGKANRRKRYASLLARSR